MIRPILSVMAAFTGSSACAGAQVATIQVTHDDADGLVTPGQVVRLTAMVSWPQAYPSLATCAGSIIAEPALGVAMNASTPQTWVGTTTGTLVAGGVAGFVATGVPPIFVPTPWFFPNVWKPDGIIVVAFDWIAPPTARGYEFKVEPIDSHPLVELFPNANAQFGVMVPTESLGTTLTVVPAPPALLVGGLVLVWRSCLRTRPARSNTSTHRVD